MNTPIRDEFTGLKDRGWRWRQRNRNKLQEYRRRNLVSRREYNQKWMAAHKDEMKVYFRLWWQRNKIKNRMNQAQRKQWKNATSDVNTEKIEKIYARAEELRRWFDVVVDHIIPLAKGGHHCADNMQIIYHFENARKKDRLDYKPRVIFT